jgi:iron complex transport system substrate-binding protein
MKLLLTLISLILLAACKPPEAATKKNNAPQDFQRIISAAPSNTEIIVALGLGEKLVAVDPYSKQIAGVKPDIPAIDFFYPDAEVILTLKPDIIIANEINSFGAADAPYRLLGDAGINVVHIPTSTTLEGIERDIARIAAALNAEEKGAAIITQMKNEIKKIACNATQKSASKGGVTPKVYFEIAPAPGIVTFGQGAYLNEIIEIAGGKNIFENQKGWFTPDAESIILKNPDIIFVMSYSGSDPVKEIKNRSAFAGITAVKNDKVFVVDGDSASRPSQNIMKAFNQIADAINQN